MRGMARTGRSLAWLAVACCGRKDMGRGVKGLAQVAYQGRLAQRSRRSPEPVKVVTTVLRAFSDKNRSLAADCIFQSYASCS